MRGSPHLVAMARGEFHGEDVRYRSQGKGSVIDRKNTRYLVFAPGYTHTVLHALVQTVLLLNCTVFPLQSQIYPFLYHMLVSTAALISKAKICWLCSFLSVSCG